MALTKEEIFAAADGLDALGQKPTLARVRAVLGTGSFTTISEGMSEWRGRQSASIPREPTPSSITDRLNIYGNEIWALALEMASTRFDSEKANLLSAQTELEEEKKQAIEIADQISTNLDQMRVELETLAAKATSAERIAKELSSQLASAMEQIHTAQTRADEIERRADDLKAALIASQEAVKSNAAEIERLHANLETERKAYQELRQNTAKEAMRTAERMNRVESERDNALKEAAQAREEAAKLDGQVDTLKTHVADLTRALSTIQNKG